MTMSINRYRDIMETTVELSLAVASLNDSSIKEDENLYVYLYNQFLIRYAYFSVEHLFSTYHRARRVARRFGITIMGEKKYVQLNYKRCRLGIRGINQPLRNETKYRNRIKTFNEDDYPF